MPKFLLVARSVEGSWEQATKDLSPADIQGMLRKYSDWSDRVRAQGKLQMGQKLRDGTGRVMRPNGSSVKVTDGPFVEGKEVIGGFWLVEADSYEEAVKLATDNPHAEHGTIEVREIEDMKP